MAIVANSGNTAEPVDKSFVHYNRTNAGDPNTVLTPQFAGEIVLDTTNSVLWKSLGTANNTWVALTSAV